MAEITDLDMVQGLVVQEEVSAEVMALDMAQAPVDQEKVSVEVITLDMVQGPVDQEEVSIGVMTLDVAAAVHSIMIVIQGSVLPYTLAVIDVELLDIIRGCVKHHQDQDQGRSRRIGMSGSGQRRKPTLWIRKVNG